MTSTPRKEQKPDQIVATQRDAAERGTQAIESALGVVLLLWIAPLFCSGH